jgi:hypothetical protein
LHSLLSFLWCLVTSRTGRYKAIVRLKDSLFHN